MKPALAGCALAIIMAASPGWAATQEAAAGPEPVVRIEAEPETVHTAPQPRAVALGVVGALLVVLARRSLRSA